MSDDAKSEPDNATIPEHQSSDETQEIQVPKQASKKKKRKKKNKKGIVPHTETEVPVIINSFSTNFVNCF